MKRIVVVVLVICLIGYLQAEYHKSQVLPGNKVIYKGKPFEVSCLTIDSKSQYKTITFLGSDRSIPADSVFNPYKPFWQTILSTYPFFSFPKGAL